MNQLFIFITGNLFKTPYNMYPLFKWENCRWLTHTACEWKGQNKILSCCNPFDTLPDSTKNFENTDNWEQFLGAMSYFHYSCFRNITWIPKSQWIWVFLWQQICGIFTYSNQFPKHPLGVQQISYFWFEICGVTADSAGWGLKIILSSDASQEVQSHSCLWSNR